MRLVTVVLVYARMPAGVKNRMGSSSDYGVGLIRTGEFSLK